MEIKKIHPLVLEAHKLKSSLDLQKSVCEARKEYVKASRLDITLCRAIKRFYRRLYKFEDGDETIIS